LGIGYFWEEHCQKTHRLLGENKEFVKPLNENGAFATVKVDQRRICGLRYKPAKYKHIYDDKGYEYVTDEVHVPAKSKA
jgi:hypothetical protein